MLLYQVHLYKKLKLVAKVCRRGCSGLSIQELVYRSILSFKREGALCTTYEIDGRKGSKVTVFNLGS